MGRRWMLAQLLRRPLAATALILVLCLVGMLVATAVAWQRGLERVASAGAHQGIVYLMARGSEDAAERSVIDESAITALRAQLAAPLAAELVHMGLVAHEGESGRVTWRGIDTSTATVRDNVTLADGRWPTADNETLVGPRVARELALAVGDRIELLDRPLQVVGLLDDGLGFAGGEIWLPRSSLQMITGRQGASQLALREGAEQATMLMMMRPDLGLVDVRETDYLAAYAARLEPLRVVAWVVSGLLAAAALAGALCAAVARAESRKAMLATLRSLGLPPLRLAGWLLAEGLALAALAAGPIALALLALDGTVLRLGGIAPVLAVDRDVILFAIAAVLATVLILAGPLLGWVLTVPLARQLQRS